MITTNDIKSKTFDVFSIGRKSSKDVICIIGSCRSVFYLNYLNIYNKTKGNKYLIYFIDPYNYRWDKDNNWLCDVEYKDKMIELENDTVLLDIFSRTKIFIHEAYKNYGMFNSIDMSEKNIYQFGMKPELNIAIPNLHDVHILFNNYAKTDSAFYKIAKEDYALYGKLQQSTQDDIVALANKKLGIFLQNVEKSSFPEFVDIFNNKWKKIRYFYTFNHITYEFALDIFKLMNDKFLNFNITDAAWQEIKRVQLYSDFFYPLCEYDIANYGIEWKEPVMSFKEYNNI